MCVCVDVCLCVCVCGESRLCHPFHEKKIKREELQPKTSSDSDMLPLIASEKGTHTLTHPHTG